MDKSVDRLLKGKTYNFIKCKNVDYSSTKTEEFLDLQLDVMGCKGVQDSLNKICKVLHIHCDAIQQSLQRYAALLALSELFGPSLAFLVCTVAVAAMVIHKDSNKLYCSEVIFKE